MCNVCGCGDTDASEARAGTPTTVHVDTPVMNTHADDARRNRERFDANGVLVVNLMSSPGAGKTSLIEATVKALAPKLRLGVVEGDLATENDAARVRHLGIQAEQITTGIACHLDAHMLGHVLGRFDLAALDVLFVEDVGNLICPACFDLGQHLNVVLLSVPEGADKPEKYPLMFRTADVVVLSKTDYLPLEPAFSIESVTASARRIGARADMLPLSTRTGIGLRAWCDWLLAARARVRANRLSALPDAMP